MNTGVTPPRVRPLRPMPRAAVPSLPLMIALFCGTGLAFSTPIATDLIHSFTRITSQPDVAKFLANRNPNDQAKIIFDVGINDGQDTRAYSTHGFIVVGVDANPVMIEQGRQQMADLIANNKVVLVHAGIEETTQGPELLFWNNIELPVLSSFERSKSCSPDTVPEAERLHCEPMKVPLMRCEALWALGTPYYLKVDIEERHYTCIRALKYMPRELLPQYVSWEMHEMAKGKRYPIIDTSLVLLLSELGYDAVKFVPQLAGDESNGMPEQATNWLTSSQQWSDVADALQRGLVNPRKQEVTRWDEEQQKNVTFQPWFDFHMRLSSTAIARHSH